MRKAIVTYYIVIILPIVAAVLAVACGPQNPNITPQANVARYAGDVIASMRIVQQTMAKSALPEPVIAKAMNGFLQAEKYANQLADALKAYDAAATLVQRDTEAATVEAILVNLNTLLFDIGAPLLNLEVRPETRTQIERLISNVQAIIYQIRSSIPQLRPTPVALERMRAPWLIFDAA